MTDETDSSVVLAELQIALFRECNNQRRKTYRLLINLLWPSKSPAMASGYTNFQKVKNVSFSKINTMFKASSKHIIALYIFSQSEVLSL